MWKNRETAEQPHTLAPLNNLFFNGASVAAQKCKVGGLFCELLRNQHGWGHAGANISSEEPVLTVRPLISPGQGLACCGWVLLNAGTASWNKMFSSFIWKTSSQIVMRLSQCSVFDNRVLWGKWLTGDRQWGLIWRKECLSVCQMNLLRTFIHSYLSHSLQTTILCCSHFCVG